MSEQPDKQNNISIEGDLEGDLSVAGRDVINQETNITNVTANLPAWAIVGGVIALIALVVVVGLAFNLPQTLGWVRPFKPAAENEVLVIVTDFSGERDVSAPQRIYDALTERVSDSDLENVRVERLSGTTPESAADAIEVGEEYDATLVIWGFADSIGLQPRYEVVRNDSLIVARSDLGITYADLPTFSAYVVEGVPNEFEYLVLFSLGQIALFQDDTDQALDHFEQALQVDIGDRGSQLDYYALHLYRTLILGGQGDIERAAEAFGQAFVYNPTLLAFVIGYTPPLDPASAVDTLSARIDASPEDAQAYTDRALAYYVQLEFDAAFADATRAIELDEVQVDAYVIQSLVYIARENLAQAIEAANLALNVNDESASATYARGWASALSGEYEAALADFSRVLELNPEQVAAYANLGVTYDAIGQTEAAIENYQRFSDLWPFPNDFSALMVQMRLETLQNGD